MPFLPSAQHNTEQLLIKVALLLEQLAEQSINHGYFLPKSSSDIDAPINSIYFSTDQTKLVYKDNLSNIHDLY